MNIIYTKSFDNTYKNLKKYHKEKSNLSDIKELIEEVDTFKGLVVIHSLKCMDLKLLSMKKMDIIHLTYLRMVA